MLLDEALEIIQNKLLPEGIEIDVNKGVTKHSAWTPYSQANIRKCTQCNAKIFAMIEFPVQYRGHSGFTLRLVSCAGHHVRASVFLNGAPQSSYSYYFLYNRHTSRADIDTKELVKYIKTAAMLQKFAAIATAETVPPGTVAATDCELVPLAKASESV